MKANDSRYLPISRLRQDTTEESSLGRWLNSSGFQDLRSLATASESSGKDEFRDLILEFAELLQAANDNIHDALQDGIDAGYHGKWRDQSFEEHIDHAIIHLQQLKWQHPGDHKEDHLSHALTRLAMAAVKEFESNVQKDSDDVDGRGEQGSGMERPETMGEISGDWKERFRGLVGEYRCGQKLNHPSKLDPR